MDSYRDSTLVFRLVSEGLRGNVFADTALHGNSAEKGRGDGLPRQFQGGRRNVSTNPGGISNGTDYGAHMGSAAATMATRNGTRVVRSVPFLAIIEGGLSDHD